MILDRCWWWHHQQWADSDNNRIGNEHIKFYVLAGKKLSKQEDLKEMGDISSGMSSSIMQLYLKQVLEAFFHTQSSVRHFALNVIALTLNQGLIHPVQVS